MPFTGRAMLHHPCLFFVKVEFGRMKMRKKYSDVKLLMVIFDEADGCM